jgi:hypothetical protein
MNEGLVERRKQEFLLNNAFVRSFEVFDTFQQLLREFAEDSEKLQEIRERMSLVFSEQSEDVDDPLKLPSVQERNKIIATVFSLCESSHLTKESFAELLAGSSFSQAMLDSWNPKSGFSNENGKVMINEVLEYNHEEGTDVVHINIVPSFVRGEDLWKKVFEGLRELAQEIKDGSLKDIHTVAAQSWLFSSPFFKERMLPLLGNNVMLTDVPEDDGDVREVQKLALSYHKGSMKEFLLHGKLPQVQLLQVDKSEFLEKFGI